MNRANMHKMGLSDQVPFQKQATALIDALPRIQDRPQSDLLIVKTGGKIVFVKLEEIVWAESARNSVRLHLRSETYSVRGSLEKLERMLSNRFLRINRSTIVNLYEVQELRSWFHGNLRVVLRDGTMHALSPSYKKHFFEILGNPFG
jgi:two-component system LytT family response regulator